MTRSYTSDVASLKAFIESEIATLRSEVRRKAETAGVAEPSAGRGPGEAGARALGRPRAAARPQG
ncbi:hypothetical protein, partial [Streptomyces sp. WAC05374]|uniref:hypothetical protein n=1 Tax=Streptomyces sp. WAC05374 TaxID=2487420 RepID=UPI000FC00B71